MKIIRYSLLTALAISFMNVSSFVQAQTYVNVGFSTDNAMPYDGFEENSLERETLYGSYQWRFIRYGRIPHHAVVGGAENGQVLYVCQARYAGGMHPGKVVAGRCNITYGGAEIPLDNFKVLVGRDLHWAKSKFGHIPPSVVQGGFENGSPLYICRAHYEFRGTHPGKIVAGACNIGYGGKEVRLDRYRILVMKKDHHRHEDELGD